MPHNARAVLIAYSPSRSRDALVRTLASHGVSVLVADDHAQLMRELMNERVVVVATDLIGQPTDTLALLRLRGRSRGIAIDIRALPNTADSMDEMALGLARHCQIPRPALAPIG